jgi:DNA-binding IclR family transcriptional regulator
VARRDDSPDFIEAIARGLDVIRAFGPGRPVMSLAGVAAASDLPRPTARRILLTLEQLGYVRAAGGQSGGQSAGGYELTPRVLDLGMSYVLSRGLWEVARPHMEALVAQTRESTSIAQLDGSDIVYVARVAVPKIVTLSVTIGTRFPAMQTSLGKVLLAALPLAEAERVLAEPSRSGITTPLAAGRGRARGGAARGAGPRLGAHRRAARPGHQVGRGAAAGRRGPGDRRDQRQLARRRDAAGRADERAPAAAVAGGGRDQRRLGRVPERAAGHGGRRRWRRHRR